jgi:hypothetical protein
MRSLILLSLVAQVAFGAVLAPRNASYACNNSPDLCSRSYSNITQLGAHDSPFLTTTSSQSIGFTNAGNQNVNSTAQLTAGVRLLTAQVHNENGSLHLCHTSCSLLDAGTLSAWLSEIKTWMDANPYDVVTILLVNSDSASAADLNAEFEAANITSYAYTPPSTTTALTTWPTLQELISNSTRLVTFVASLNPASNTVAPYLLDEFTFVFENPYNVTNISNFSCVADRPPTVQGQTATATSSGRLPLVNHFLYKDVGFGINAPDTGNITTTNGKTGLGSLGQAASDCSAAYGKAPAFLLVGFFDEGSTIGIVNSLNGVESSTTGQTRPSVAASSDAGGRSGGGPFGQGSGTILGLAVAIIACLV